MTETKKVRMGDAIVVGFAMFATFFGAGNMIFPPFMGNRTGDQWFIGFLCFILADAGLDKGKLICVHKPFMERRLCSAMGVYWPEINAVYTSPLLELEEYIVRTMAQGMTEKAVIDVLVGDFQRMDVYAKKGYQLPQEIPDACWQAFHALVELGYTGELVT